MIEHVEFTGRAPDELVEPLMSTAAIGLSPDPMNKTMEYMSYELPVVLQIEAYLGVYNRLLAS